MASSIELIDFRAEGIHSLKDIGYAINEGRISEVLPSSSSSVYLNIITREGKEFCVLLDKSGYQVTPAGQVLTYHALFEVVGLLHALTT